MTESLHRHYAAMVLALLLLGTFGLGAGEVSALEPGIDIGKEIESANTKADHEAIAAFYQEEAKRIDEDIARHKRMSAAYQKTRHLRQLAVRMKKHCDMLIKNYEDAAVEMREMARAHRDTAAELP